MKIDVRPAVVIGFVRLGDCGCPSFAKETKVREKHKEEEQRKKPEKINKFKGEVGWKWEERQKDWKGGRVVAVRKGGRGWMGGRRRGGRNETKFSLAISVFLLQVLGPFH